MSGRRVELSQYHAMRSIITINHISYWTRAIIALHCWSCSRLTAALALKVSSLSPVYQSLGLNTMVYLYSNVLEVLSCVFLLLLYSELRLDYCQESEVSIVEFVRWLTDWTSESLLLELWSSITNIIKFWSSITNIINSQHGASTTPRTPTTRTPTTQIHSY